MHLHLSLVFLACLTEQPGRAHTCAQVFLCMLTAVALLVALKMSLTCRMQQKKENGAAWTDVIDKKFKELLAKI